MSIDTAAFKGDVLVYQNEWCPNTTNRVGGISLVDVTNPRAPKKLVEGAGNFTKKNGGRATACRRPRPTRRTPRSRGSSVTPRARRPAVSTSCSSTTFEEPDVDILDISDPSKPKLVSRTNLSQFAQTGPTRPHGDSVFSHDMVVKRIGSRDVMLMSYWDGGYITLDVSDPATPKPLSDTDFTAVDPARVPYGQTTRPRATPIRPSSRATTSSSSPRTRTSTPSASSRVRWRSSSQPGVHRHPGRRRRTVNNERPLVGDTHFLGLGCDAVPSAGGNLIAVVERGVCDFQVKLDNIEAAGYKGLIVFNRTGEDGCETLVSMLAASETTRRSSSRARTASRLLGVDRRLVHVQRGRHRHGDARRPVRAGGHLRRLRRLGLHAHVPDRPDAGREAAGGRDLRP